MCSSDAEILRRSVSLLSDNKIVQKKTSVWRDTSMQLSLFQSLLLADANSKWIQYITNHWQFWYWLVYSRREGLSLKLFLVQLKPLVHYVSGAQLLVIQPVREARGPKLAPSSSVLLQLVFRWESHWRPLFTTVLFQFKFNEAMAP